MTAIRPWSERHGLITFGSTQPEQSTFTHKVVNQEEVNMNKSVLFGALTVAGLAAGAAAAGTLDDVKARGKLNCGVSTGLVGFAAPDANGEWKGFDVRTNFPLLQNKCFLDVRRLGCLNCFRSFLSHGNHHRIF